MQNLMYFDTDRTYCRKLCWCSVPQECGVCVCVQDVYHSPVYLCCKRRTRTVTTNTSVNRGSFGCKLLSTKTGIQTAAISCANPSAIITGNITCNTICGPTSWYYLFTFVCSQACSHNAHERIYMRECESSMRRIFCCLVTVCEGIINREIKRGRNNVTCGEE